MQETDCLLLTWPTVFLHICYYRLSNQRKKRVPDPQSTQSSVTSQQVQPTVVTAWDVFRHLIDCQLSWCSTRTSSVRLELVSHWQCYNVLPREAIQGVQAAKHALPPQHRAALNFTSSPSIISHECGGELILCDRQHCGTNQPASSTPPIKLLDVQCLHRENGRRGRVPEQCNGWAPHVITSVASSQGRVCYRQRKRRPYGG